MDALPKRAKEADVEARIVLPLLTSAEFLGIPHSSVRGKAYLYPRRIDKAAGKTSGYYPDFSVWEESLPLVVVEAKAPSVPAETGYREASQYALHINRKYSENIDPCSYIVATNGQRLLAGPWNADPEIDIAVTDLVVGSAALETLHARISSGVLKQRGMALRQAISGGEIYRATKGSQTSTLINSRVPPNRFASVLIPTLTRYFASPTDDTDPAVYDVGYVPTNENSNYDSILEGLLREKALNHRNPFSKSVRTTRTDTKEFSQRIQEYRDQQLNTAQIVLVIGHVGAGKSLFIRRYRELLVPESIEKDLYWSFINFNDVPTNLSEKWVSEKFLESFSAENTQIDLYDPNTIEHIFDVELNSNRSVYQKLGEISPADEMRERASDLKRWIADPEKFSRGVTRYFDGQKRGVCIAVFDNVDKLDKDNQLAVFQLALGFTTDHRTLTILQLRDETYERYKDSKPLDTFKTGISFHVTPPRFGNVVKKRLEIAFEDLSTNAPKSWEYDLNNGVRVKISREQALAFLSDIYEYVFGVDVNASRILQGLAGRNVRRALEIFFRVMISGHLASDQITSMGAGGTSFPITDDLVLRTLMRGDNRFFHNDAAFVANIFYFDPTWTGADNLLLPEILYFLGANLKTQGTIGLEGFFTVDGIFETLQFMGYPRSTVFAATQWLLLKGLIEADDMASDELKKSTAVRISSSGFIHIRVLSARLEYVAGCLYEAPYLASEMADFANGMFADSVGTGGLSPTRKARGVQEFRKYVRTLGDRRDKVAPNLVGMTSGLDYVLRHIEQAIAEAIRPMRPLSNERDALDI